MSGVTAGAIQNEQEIREFSSKYYNMDMVKKFIMDDLSETFDLNVPQIKAFLSNKGDIKGLRIQY